MLEDLLVNPEEESGSEGVCNRDFIVEEDILPEGGGKGEFLMVACIVVMVWYLML
jgi:hypothetical protein